jgi:DNA modification methylase
MPRKKLPAPSGPALFPDWEEDPWNAHANGSRRKIAQERLPTNTTTHQHPIHRWFNFIAGFSPEFVEECCAGVTAPDPPPLFLDPFAGCATGPLVACQHGMRAIGYEPHPFFARVAKAKFPGPDALAELDGIERILAQGLRRPVNLSLLPEAPKRFLRKLFPEESLESLLGAREALDSEGLRDSDLAFLILSRVLDKSSHSQTDGIYKAPTSRKEARSPAAAFRETVQGIRFDLEGVRGRDFQALARIFQESAEDMRAVDSDSVSLLVTSPPYLNNFDFAEMTRMYLYFWEMATTWGEITAKVRGKLIVNTTTALKGHKERQGQCRAAIPPRLCGALDPLVQELAARRLTKAGKKEYDLLVYPYFAQMTTVLRECWRCLRPGAGLHVLVADAALYGVHLSTPQFLWAIIQELGFRNASCTLVRRRGHRWVLSKREGSQQGLGEYHISAIK